VVLRQPANVSLRLEAAMYYKNKAAQALTFATTSDNVPYRPRTRGTTGPNAT